MIRNINRLKLSAENQQKLLTGARLHKQHSNIQFWIKRVTKAAVIIEVTQGYPMSENYASAGILEERTRELFKDYVTDKEILVEAKTYSPAENEMPAIPVLFDDERRKKPKTKSYDYDNGIDKPDVKDE